MRILKSLVIVILFCFALLSCKKGQEAENSNGDSVSSTSDDTITKNLDSAAVFIEMIPAHIERQYTTKFAEAASKHPNLIDKFTLDYSNFKELIEKYTNYKSAKFYFIQDSNTSKLNLGLALSNNTNFQDLGSDKKFILSNGKFIDGKKLNEQIGFYQRGLASQTNFNGKKATQCVIYKVSDIENYFVKMESKSVVSQLNFNMIYFVPAKDNDGSDYTSVPVEKYDRISFSVHAIDTSGNFVDDGFDAGDLKP